MSKYLVMSNTGEDEILAQLIYIGKQAELMGDTTLLKVVFACLLDGYLRGDKTLDIVLETDDLSGMYPIAVYNDMVSIESQLDVGNLISVPILWLSPTAGITVTKTATIVSCAFRTEAGWDGSTKKFLWEVFARLVSKEHALYCSRVFYDYNILAGVIEEMNVLREAPKDEGLDEWFE